MKDADAEPIDPGDLEGQGDFRLDRVSGRSANHENDQFNAAWLKGYHCARIMRPRSRRSDAATGR